MTGQILMEIADVSKPFTLELELPEKREGHLDDYIKQEEVEKLEVSYILFSDPDAPLTAELLVKNISKRAEPNEEHGGIIKMHADPNLDELKNLQPRPGTKMVAKVYCGRASSGFVFFHEIYEWCCKFFF